jgi:hypothetical protein
MSEKRMEDGPSASDQVDEQRRSAMCTMAGVLSYVPPAVATFAMSGMSIREAHAYASNSTSL